MSTKAEMIYSVKELLKDHTDDTFIIEEHVSFQIDNMRTMLLRQLYSDRAKKFDAAASQTFCIGMEQVDNGLCGARTNCTVLRSTEKIPGLLSVKSRSSLIRVGPPVIGTKAYDMVDPAYLGECIDDPYGSHAIFIENEYLYLVGSSIAAKLIKCVSVTGIFEDPEALAELNNSCDNQNSGSCYTVDTDYPVPAFMIGTIIQEVVKLYVKVKPLEQHRDTDNNAVPE